MGMPHASTGWTAERVRAIPDDGNRYELIDGVLVVTPAPRGLHQLAVWELGMRLRGWLRGTGIAELLGSPADIALGENEMRRYQRAGIPEYWIVDLDARLIERWRPDEARPEVLTDRLIWEPTPGQDALEVDVAAFFATVYGEEMR